MSVGVMRDIGDGDSAVNARPRKETPKWPRYTQQAFLDAVRPSSCLIMEHVVELPAIISESAIIIFTPWMDLPMEQTLKEPSIIANCLLGSTDALLPSLFYWPIPKISQHIGAY